MKLLKLYGVIFLMEKNNRIYIMNLPRGMVSSKLLTVRQKTSQMLHSRKPKSKWQKNSENLSRKKGLQKQPLKGSSRKSSILSGILSSVINQFKTSFLEELTEGITETILHH